MTVGGVNAQVVFSGIRPGLPGVYQINIIVPAGSPTGNAVPLQIQMGGITTSNHDYDRSEQLTPRRRGDAVYLTSNTPNESPKSRGSPGGRNVLLTSTRHLHLALADYAIRQGERRCERPRTHRSGGQRDAIHRNRHLGCAQARRRNIP